MYDENEPPATWDEVRWIVLVAVIVLLLFNIPRCGKRQPDPPPIRRPRPLNTHTIEATNRKRLPQQLVLSSRLR